MDRLYGPLPGQTLSVHGERAVRPSDRGLHNVVQRLITPDLPTTQRIANVASDGSVGTALREATVKGGFVSAEEFDRVVGPQKMVGNPRRDLGIA